MGTISTMSPTEGDVEIKWDPENEREVELAKKAFEAAKEKGIAYEVQKSGKKVLVHEFDRDAEHIVVTPLRARG